MNPLAKIGSSVLERLRGLSYIAAVVAAVMVAAIRPRTWRRTVRLALSRQIVAIGVDAIGSVLLIALIEGVLIVVQVQWWVGKVAQSRLLGPVLVAVVIRELGPLMTNFMIIARSGNMMAAELANMKISGGVRALDVQGIDPFTYLLVPRVLGMVIASICLTAISILVALGSGYFCARLAHIGTGGPASFANTVARAIGRADLLTVVGKTSLPALLCGVICCLEGLSASDTPFASARAASRGLQRSIVVLFMVSAAISVLTYA